MNLSFRKVVFLCCLALSVSAQAQVPQELIDKAKAAGMTDEQIQAEIAKRMPAGGGNDQTQKVATAASATVSDRKMPDKETPRIDIPVANLEDLVFGREIFSNKQLSFSPDLNIPTPKDYILSAGDELLINVWGDSELNLKLRISPDGTVLIPNLGPVAVSGLTINAAESRLRQELSQIMSTLSSNGQGNTFVSLSLSQIRSLKVNIVGEVESPGTYTLPSFATLFNALYMAGGVNNIGSLRSIKVFRNSKQVADLDVYDYLLHGKFNTNIRLEENDMIMVGPYDRLAIVRGKVKRNRIFELRKGETLQQLLDMAGGFTGEAFKKEVQIKRKSDTRYQIATVPDTKYASFLMQDGDVVQIDGVIPYFENRLQIKGAVWRPGEYELSSSVRTVKQLVKQAAGLKGDEFAGRAQITRLNADFTTTVIAIDIRGILNGSSPDVELQSEDVLFIPSMFDLREPYTIRVSGAVNAGDASFPYHHNTTIEDAIVMAGGLRESAATINVEVARRVKNPTSSENISQIAKLYTFTLDEELKVNTGDTIFTLEPFDEVYVRFSPGYQKQQSVKIDGEVTFNGNYVLDMKNARLSDIVAKAGGITPEAFVRGANLKRQMTEDELARVETLLAMSAANKESRDSIGIGNINVKTYSVGIDLEKALAKPGSADDVVLRDGDELYIPQHQSTVKMSGAVVYPNSVTYTKGMTVKECLSQAGGYNDLSRKYPVVIYMNGKVATTKRRLFCKIYPKVEPGCEVIVPLKAYREPKSLAEVLAIGTSATSMAAMITSVVNMMNK